MGCPAGRLRVMALSDRERAVLDFERSWWVAPPTEPSSKEARIRQRLDLSPTRYYQLLNQLADCPEAADYDPLVTRRVRRRREQKRRERFEGRPTGGRRMR